MMAPTTIRSPRPIEVPLVCPNCTLVHRVGRDAFATPTVVCPSCGHGRATSQIVALMPRALRF